MLRRACWSAVLVAGVLGTFTMARAQDLPPPVPDASARLGPLLEGQGFDAPGGSPVETLEVLTGEEVGEGEGAVAVEDGCGVGGASGDGGDEVVEGAVGDGEVGAVGEAGEVDGIEEREAREGEVGTVECGAEEASEEVGEASDGGAVEEIGGELEGAGEGRRRESGAQARGSRARRRTAAQASERRAHGARRAARSSRRSRARG